MIYDNHSRQEDELNVITDENQESILILYNDDINTFDHVIECLVKYCKHSPEQAEQCALIVHYKGRCIVKRGALQQINIICSSLCKQGLRAVVED